MSQIKTVRTQGTPPHIPVIEPLSINQNGTYTAPTGVDGYSPITVDVQEEPWAPLEDGYSNFWFELTDDTLSPWLNFSAKNNDAVIDWGDGSGEVALDTLTPTHTYAKAGKYVVKVKGVTETGRMFTETASAGGYYSVLKAIELNSEFRVINYMSFANTTGLDYVYIHSGLTDLRSNSFTKSSIKSITIPDTVTLFYGGFDGCTRLKEFTVPQNIQSVSTATWQNDFGLQKIIIPSAVTTIGNNVCYGNTVLREIHIQATTPPTLGTNMFTQASSYYIIYVPVGTGETYKAAAGWSTYADHIVEEGQTLSRAALRRIQAEKTTDESEGDDVR